MGGKWDKLTQRHVLTVNMEKESFVNETNRSGKAKLQPAPKWEGWELLCKPKFYWGWENWLEHKAESRGECRDSRIGRTLALQAANPAPNMVQWSLNWEWRFGSQHLWVWSFILKKGGDIKMTGKRVQVVNTCLVCSWSLLNLWCQLHMTRTFTNKQCTAHLLYILVKVHQEHKSGLVLFEV